MHTAKPVPSYTSRLGSTREFSTLPLAPLQATSRPSPTLGMTNLPGPGPPLRILHDHGITRSSARVATRYKSRELRHNIHTSAYLAVSIEINGIASREYHHQEPSLRPPSCNYPSLIETPSPPGNISIALDTSSR